MKPARSTAVEVVYDSDAESSDSTTQSSDSDDSKPSPPPPAALVARIPPELLRPPILPQNGFVWNCSDCERSIDLLRLSEDDVRCLDDRAGAALRQRNWELHRPDVREAFLRMIRDHHNTHLRQCGVELAPPDGKGKARHTTLNQSLC